MKILTFTLADKHYGLKIDQVLRVIAMRPPTPVPETADFVEGVISLRGKIIPLINLRKKFSLSAGFVTKTSRIIVCRLDTYFVGVIVDSVLDVLTLEDSQITPPDDVLKNVSYLLGVLRKSNDIFLVIDMQSLLSHEAKVDLDHIRERVEIRKRACA